MTIADLAKTQGPDYDHPGTGGDGVGPVYTNWDKDSVMSCVCYPGYFGPDCSETLCPKNDDPITVGQNSRAITMDLTADAGATGNVRFTFMGFTSALSITASSVECKAAMERLLSVEEVTCTRAAVTDGFRYTIKFKKFPVFSSENNIHSHNGNPSLDMFHCDISDVSGTNVECVLADSTTINIQEYEFCSGRGLCDFSTGECACIEGFTGVDCSETSYFSSATNSLPGAYIEATGNDYTGTILAVRSEKSAAVDFKVIDAVVGGTTAFEVRGDGRVLANEVYVAGNGMTIDDGGLYVTEGGLTLVEGQTDTFFSENDDYVVTLTASSEDYGGSNANLLQLFAADTTSLSDFNFISAGDAVDSAVFTVRGDGKVTADGGVNSGAGLEVTTGGATITAGGLSMPADDISMTDGKIEITGDTDGLTVKSTGSTASRSGVSLQRSASSSTDYNFIEVIDDYDSSPSTVFSISADPTTTIHQGGLTVVGGATISSGGLSVSTSGATISGAVSVVGLESTAAITGTSAVFSGSVSANGHIDTSSDRRLKTDIASLRTRAESVLNLNGVSYRMKTNSSGGLDGNRTSGTFGFIAQDVQEHFPEIVRERSDGLLSLEYTAIVPLVVELLKQQQEQINELKQEVHRLNQQNAGL